MRLELIHALIHTHALINAHIHALILTWSHSQNPIAVA